MNPSFLAALWQAAAQAPDCQAFAARVLPWLGPGADLLVWRLDRAGQAMEREAGPGPLHRRALSPGEWAEAAALASRPRPWTGPVGRLADGLSWLVPATWQGRVAVAGLAGEAEAAMTREESAGLLLLTAPAADLEDLVLDLAPPCAAALANQQRWRTLNSEREAAEAERRAVLQRLKRPGLGDAIVGADAGLREVMEAVEQVAPADAPVLILGETGTGKEVVARAVHLHSRRARGPFLRVNCGAIPPELIDSELFGHERGSFTGATGARKGWFERADGGTLFLDEIGELPPAAQVRLLRVLQDGSFQRVGGEKSLTVDVRLVAATNRDLRAAVATGEFREDLWFRIAVFPIPLPPLRARPQDIPALAAHFSLRAAERLGLPPRMPDARDLALLAAYPWPGNVRELGSVIERAAILGNGRHLEVARALGGHPLVAMVSSEAGPDSTGPDPGQGLPPGQPDPLSLEAANRRCIQEALVRCHGRVDGPFGAARLLGLNPNTLRSRMRKLGLVPRRFRAPQS